MLLTGAASLALCIIGARWQKKKIEALHGQLIDFLEGREPSPRFSVNDDDFALFENAIVELESRLLLEQEKTQRESQKNADFIADVSHQLKTPLAALKLYCEMGQAQNPGKDISRQLALIERMENLIYSLLRLEKLRADAYEMRFADHDLSALAGQVWAELQPLYPERRFQLAGSANLRCDGYWIGEALRNILKNSCEHTPPSCLLYTSRRNVTLFRHGCRLRADGADERAIRGELLDLNDARCDPPLEVGEVRRIAASAARYPPGPVRVDNRLLNAARRVCWISAGRPDAIPSCPRRC